METMMNKLISKTRSMRSTTCLFVSYSLFPILLVHAQSAITELDPSLVVGVREDMRDTQRIPPDGTPNYVKIDLYAGYKINDNYQVSLGLNNLVDEAYRVNGSGNNESGFGVNLGVKATF